MRQRGIIEASGYVPYPASRLSRVKLAVLVLFLGWLFWLFSMFVPVGYVGVGRDQRAVSAFFDCALVMIYAVSSPLQPFGHYSDSRIGLGSPYLFPVTFTYCLAILTLWWPVIFRCRPVALWFYRSISLGMLLPSLIAWKHFIKSEPQAGTGGIIWAFASVLIGLSIWICPSRLSVEPRFILTLFRRVSGGHLLVTAEPLPAAHSFPVVPTPAPSRH